MRTWGIEVTALVIVITIVTRITEATVELMVRIGTNRSNIDGIHSSVNGVHHDRSHC